MTCQNRTMLAEQALAMMRNALVLLDEAGLGMAAARLQHAVDELLEITPTLAPDDAEAARSPM